MVWIHNPKVGTDGNREAWIRLDEAVLVVREPASENSPGKLHVNFPYPINERPVTEYDRGNRPHTRMELTNRWTVFDVETQEKIVQELNQLTNNGGI